MNNGNGTFVQLAKYGGFGVAIAAILGLIVIANSQSKAIGTDVRDLREDIQTHDDHAAENTAQIVDAMRDLEDAMRDQIQSQVGIRDITASWKP